MGQTIATLDEFANRANNSFFLEWIDELIGDKGEHI